MISAKLQAIDWDPACCTRRPTREISRATTASEVAYLAWTDNKMKIMRTIKSLCGVCLLLLLSIANHTQIKIDTGAAKNRTCLPTGVCLDPVGRSFAVGNMPLAMVLSPEGDRIVISLSGWRQQGLQVVERDTGAVVQTISQPGAFLGLAFSRDGRTLYASGGNEDVIYRYAWRDKQASLVGALARWKEIVRRGESCGLVSGNRSCK